MAVDQLSKIELTTPLSDAVVEELRIGQRVLLQGMIYTGRDAAHKRMAEAIERGEDLPFDLTGQVLYYVGPSPAGPGRVIGAAGPTTSGRMDMYAPRLYALGLKGTIGKGPRSPEVLQAMRQYKGIYFAAVGGAAALLARRIKKAELLAYPELGPEAVYRLLVEDFPVIVVNDTRGGDLYQESVRLYAEPDL